MLSSSALSAYFRRIGLPGTPQSTLDFVSELQFRQMSSIPFENLDLHLERRISLDLESITEKLVTGSRGGYCYELNSLIANILQQVGLDVEFLAARSRLDEPSALAFPKTHMTLLVTIEERRYLVDTGFGAHGPTSPLLFEPGAVHDVRGRNYRIDEAGANLFSLAASFGREWKTLYDFTRAPCVRADYEVMNYYNSTSPHSRFRKKRIVSICEGDTRIVLVDRTLFTGRDVFESVRTIASAEEYGEVLLDVFGIDLGAEAGALYAMCP